MKKSKLNNSVIIITGASNGIGKASANYLFEKGANVVKADILIHNECLTENTEGGCTKRMLEVPLDVRDIESWNNLFKTVMREFGKADVLINCAGIIIPGSLNQQYMDLVENQLNTNLLGPIMGSKVFLPLFRKLKKGHIINISSLAGITPIPFETIYCASKFGLRGFSLALSYELKKTGINVTVICPDSVLTNQILTEAHHNNANLSFTGKILSTEYIAWKIYNTILKPRKEVLITPARGLLCKLGGNSTAITDMLLPFFNKIGERKRKKFLSELNIKELKKC